MSDQKPDHTFVVPLRMSRHAPVVDACAHGYGISYCGLPRAAHPAEPAPESEEPPNPKQHGSNRVRCQCPGCYCTVPACWQTWLCFHCGEDEECCHEEPARPEPSPSLRSVMREILRATGDGHHHDGIVSEEDQCPTCSAVTRLLESVVRDDARLCGDLHDRADDGEPFCDTAILCHWGLSPESAPEPKGGAK